MIGAQPRTSTLLVRGATRRCPACGSGRLFKRWMTIKESCPRCGLRFERIEGHWIGALGINTVVSFGAILICLAVGLGVTLPNPPVVPLVLLNVAVAVIVPLAFYPVSRTLWTGIDIAMRPLEPHEIDWTKLPPNQSTSHPTNDPGGDPRGRTANDDE